MIYKQTQETNVHTLGTAGCPSDVLIHGNNMKKKTTSRVQQNRLDSMATRIGDSYPRLMTADANPNRVKDNY